MRFDLVLRQFAEELNAVGDLWGKRFQDVSPHGMATGGAGGVGADEAECRGGVAREKIVESSGEKSATFEMLDSAEEDDRAIIWRWGEWGIGTDEGMGNDRRGFIDREKRAGVVDYGLSGGTAAIGKMNGGEFQCLDQLLLGADRCVVGFVSDGGAAM